MHRSRPLADTLLENDMVDEIRHFIFPIIVGDGEPIFASLSDKVTLRRMEVTAVGESLVHQTYEVVL